MWMTLLRGVIAGVIVVAVTETARRSPRVGGLILSLPVVSILAFMFTWWRYGDSETISRLSRETLVLVPLGLVFFLPLAFIQRLGLGFWGALGLGILLAAVSLGMWLAWGPKLS